MMWRLKTSLALLCSSLAVLARADEAATLIVQKAMSECANFNNGTFNSTEKTITLHDLTGDGRPEEIVDAAQMSCSSAASLWGGSGGTLLWVVVDGEAYEFLAHGWQVVRMHGHALLLLAVHSSQCSSDIGPCYRALVWHENGFRTTR